MSVWLCNVVRNVGGFLFNNVRTGQHCNLLLCSAVGDHLNVAVCLESAVGLITPVWPIWWPNYGVF